MTDVVGNGIATAVVAKCEGKFVLGRQTQEAPIKEPEDRQNIPATARA